MTYRQPDQTNTTDVQRYASDLSDAEWAIIEPLLPKKYTYGRARTIDLREVINAINYRIRTGCQWRMLPKDFPPWGHVTYYYYNWQKDGIFEKINTALYQLLRTQEGRAPNPSTIIIDSQSVPSTAVGGEKGFDPHKHIKGRKRTIVVDTLGCMCYALVCAASLVDTEIGTAIAYDAQHHFPQVKKFW